MAKKRKEVKKTKEQLLIEFFQKKFEVLTGYTVRTPYIIKQAHQTRIKFRMTSEGLTFDNLVEISKITGSKDINIGSEHEGGDRCECGPDDYCYCEGPTSFVTISAALTNNRIFEITGML